MGRAVLEVVGLREFTSHLRRLGGTTLAKRVRMANLEVSQLMASALASEAPRGKASDHDSHIGQLAASTKALATQRVAKVRIGRGLDYTKPVIFGWPKHHIAPNPYAWRVRKDIEPDLPEIYEKAIATAIKEAEAG